MYKINQTIKIQIRRINLEYSVIDKTYPLANPQKYFKDISKMTGFIKEKYKDCRIKLLKENIGPISRIEEDAIKKELSDILI